MYTPLNDKFNVWLRVGAAGAFSAVMVAYTKVRFCYYADRVK